MPQILNQVLVCLATSSTAPALNTGGTIATVNLGASQVAPNGNATGCILAPGTYLGQVVAVLCVGSGSITFAAQATSNVNGAGVRLDVPPNAARWYVWNGALWVGGQ